MSHPKSPYTRLVLPEVPGEQDEVTVIQPNVFNRSHDSSEHISPSKKLNKQNSNPLLRKIFEEDSEQQNNLPPSFPLNPPKSPPHLSSMKVQSHHLLPGQTPNEGLYLCEGLSGQINNFQVKASQLTFNNQGDRSNHDMSAADSQAEENKPGMLKRDNTYSSLGSQSRPQQNYRVISLQEDASNQGSTRWLEDSNRSINQGQNRHLRKLRADESRRSRSRSKKAGNKFPTFEPPVYILDPSEMVQPSSTVVQIVPRPTETFQNNSGQILRIARGSNAMSDMTIEAHHNDFTAIKSIDGSPRGTTYSKPPVASQRYISQDKQIQVISPSHASAIYSPRKSNPSPSIPSYQSSQDQAPTPFIRPIINPQPADRFDGGGLTVPQKTIDANNLRESKFVTEELIKEKEETTEQIVVPQLPLRLPALEDTSHVSYIRTSAGYQKTIQATSPSTNDPRLVQIQRESLTGPRQTITVDSVSRFTSPPRHYEPRNLQQGSPGFVQSERRLHTNGLSNHLDRIVNIGKLQPPVQITSQSPSNIPGTSLQSRPLSTTSLSITILPNLLISPQSNAFSIKINELILENSRLRNDLSAEKVKSLSTDQQLRRLAHLETDFYLLLNHVTKTEASMQASKTLNPQKDPRIANDNTPILMELLEVNSLLQKEKAKLEECIREREKVEGIIKGLKIKLREQVSRFSTTSNDKQRASHGVRKSSVETPRGADCYSVECGTEERHMSTLPRTEMIKVVSEKMGNGNYVDHESQDMSRKMQANPLMMYGSMMSTSEIKNNSPTLNYSTSQLNEKSPAPPADQLEPIQNDAETFSPALHSLRPLFTITSAEYQETSDIVAPAPDKTPTLGASPYQGQKVILKNPGFTEIVKKDYGMMNGFESQEHSPRTATQGDLQINRSFSQSNEDRSLRSQRSTKLNQPQDNLGNQMAASLNPLAISKSIVSNNANTPRQQDEFKDGPFHIVLEKNNSLGTEESSMAGARRIISRYGTIIPTKEDEISKLKEIIENLSKENNRLETELQQAQSPENRTAAIKEPTSTTNQRKAANLPTINIADKDEKPMITIKLPKSGSFGDYSSSEHVQTSAAFCEVHLTDKGDEDQVKRVKDCDSRAPSPEYKNIDFFGDRPSVPRGKTNFINIHEAQKQAPAPEVGPHVSEENSENNFVSIYSFQPNNEMLSLLNHSNPSSITLNQIHSHLHTHPNLHKKNTLGEIIEEETGTEQGQKSLLISEMNAPGEDKKGEDTPSKSSKLANIVNLYSKLKKMKSNTKSQTKVRSHGEDQEEELPTRHTGNKDEGESRAIDDVQEDKHQTSSNRSKKIPGVVADLSKAVEELAAKMKKGTETPKQQTQIDSELKKLKLKINLLTRGETSPSCDLEEEEKSVAISQQEPESEGGLTMEDLKAKYLKLLREKGDTNRRLKEEKEKSQRYREMVMAKLRAIETMKDVYQRQIERMVDSEIVEDDSYS